MVLRVSRSASSAARCSSSRSTPSATLVMRLTSRDGRLVVSMRERSDALSGVGGWGRRGAVVAVASEHFPVRAQHLVQLSLAARPTVNEQVKIEVGAQVGEEEPGGEPGSVAGGPHPVAGRLIPGLAVLVDTAQLGPDAGGDCGRGLV